MNKYHIVLLSLLLIYQFLNIICQIQSPPKIVYHLKWITNDSYFPIKLEKSLKQITSIKNHYWYHCSYNLFFLNDY
jgi:hypothetical protein